MKFRATVKVSGEQGEKDAGRLVKAFFEDFNYESTIFIGKGVAEIEIVFEDKIPYRMANALGNCKVIGFEYGRRVEEFKKEDAFKQNDQVVEEVKNPQNTKQTHQEEKNSKQMGIVARGSKTFEVVSVPVEEEKIPKQVKSEVEREKVLDQEQKKSKEPEVIKQSEQLKSEEKEEKTCEKIKPVVIKEIPELTEIAKKCNSYEEFVNELTKCIGFGKKNEFFVNMVKAATQTEDIKWDTIKEVFKNNNFEYSESNKVFCTARVTEKFRRSKNPVKILELIKIIVTYQAFDFQKENEELEDKHEEKQWFNDLLGTIDKTHDLNTKVMNVLTAMGLDDEDTEVKRRILAVAYTAVNTKTFDMDVVFEKANIPEDNRLNTRAMIGSFVNKYLERIGYSEKVKVVEFLEDLINILV